MQPVVVRQLRVERGEKHRPLTDDDRRTFVLGEGLDRSADTFHLGGADEYGSHLADAANVDVGLERLRLPSVRVAPDVDVHDADDRIIAVGDRACTRDHAGARPEYRNAFARAHTERVEQPVRGRELPDRRGLTPRDDQPVGSGIFKSEDPAVRAKAIVEATTYYNDPDVLAKVTRGLGEPMRGLDVRSMPESERLADRGW